MKRYVIVLAYINRPCTLFLAPAFIFHPRLQERQFIEPLSPYHYRINPGFVPNMRVPGVVYVNERLQGLLFEELQAACQRGEHGGFLPAVKQIANVAALPGIVSVSALCDNGFNFLVD